MNRSLILNKLNKENFIKNERLFSVLFELIKLYIKTEKPISSNTLKSSSFNNLSSATIRNYFAKLEKLGYLKRSHRSGGRIPTTLALREFANNCLKDLKISGKEEKEIFKNLTSNCKKLKNYLMNSAEFLSKIGKCTVFLTFPLLEQDFIRDIKLLKLSDNNILCIIITDFGQIKTEILSIEENISPENIKKIENFFLWMLSKKSNTEIDEKSKKIAQKLYNEIMLRYVTSFSSESKKIYRTGFSNLLIYPEFKDPVMLSNILSLFDDEKKIDIFLKESIKLNRLTSWIGEELYQLGNLATNCCIIAIPYRINHIPIGAIAVLLPKRVNYNKIFTVMSIFSKKISKTLTKSIYKFKIDFKNFYENQKEDFKYSIMLEDKSKIEEKNER
ncbi:MAG: hypothetical protein AMS24_01705 [Chlamydiae bacterium SM23_39]|nr:MAG: hypothetical protein AMS24_01705 [Chlamydiae bacterium SM23_39]